MNYYITPSAYKYYPTPLSQTIWKVDNSMQKSLCFLDIASALGRFYNPSNQLDLPIFFITDADLGKCIEAKELVYVEKRYVEEESSIFQTTQFSLPEKVFFPNEKSFGLGRYVFDRCFEIIKGLVNPANLTNPNCGIFEFDESEGSHDWLGLYRGYGSELRAIFIRIDKIMDEPLLNNSLGVASIVLHELGHALMDANKNPRPGSMKFRQNIWLGVANLIYYILEESLANMIAYFGICKGFEKTSPYVENIVKFMSTEQPYPYTLGVRFGEADSSKLMNQVRVAKLYVECWYKAKKGAQIYDVSGWVQLISSKSDFTSDDLELQCDTLFGGKKRNRVSPVDATQLYVRGEDAFGREGVMIGGVYIPFKNGYASRSNDKFVIAPIFDSAEEFSDKLVPGYGYLALVEEKGKWGIIRPDGTYFIKPEFDSIQPFSEGFAVVRINWCEFEGDYGYIKPDGTYLVPPVLRRANPFRHGYANVKTAESGVKLCTQPDGSRILKSSDDEGEGKRFNNKEGYIDTNGHWHDDIPKSKN